MPVFESMVRSTSEGFIARRAHMMELVEEFRALERSVRQTSNSKIEKFRGRGQLLPRERIAALLDDGAPWIELSTLAGLGMHDDDGERNILGGGAIIGIGWVSGVRCVVSASDSAIKGGTIAPMGLKKSLRAQEIAMTNKLPLVSMVESGGANLNYQAEIFIEGGKAFRNQARMSALGIPQVTLVHGSSTAGGAYMPGLSDYVIMVEERARVFLAGPPLLKAATGEIATDEELGGARMHAETSGVSEFLAVDDADAIRLAREVVANLGWEASPHIPGRRSSWDEPLYDPDELCGVVPTDYRKPVDVHEVIARLTDGSDLLPFKALYGPHTVCAMGHITGFGVGFIGNNGPIDQHGAAKAAHFIQLCAQANRPIIFLQNTTGYLVGKEAERAGIVKHGSKMIQAVTNAPVPKITLHIGASFGAGNYGMCGRSYDPHFIFAWPNNRVAVMGGEQAAQVMEIVTRQKMERRGQTSDDDFLQGMKDYIISKIDSESTALFATARLWDDGLIDPRETRRVLAMALSICKEGQVRHLHPNTFGIARM